MAEYQQYTKNLPRLLLCFNSTLAAVAARFGPLRRAGCWYMETQSTIHLPGREPSTPLCQDPTQRSFSPTWV
ncbi:hypothetical protein TGAM01_v202693 [Trichoderma gamsii]|uniref:Uncharacterized protein n=1 Tax=Trichoderma gamsii TaxID=398673 RepID=A0A2P4ZV82_9HYPO|nr:hypothetical protein TGAM01_v202693 [Trichoderma gamsii]PON28199.1 hypothetical protein TGAM01_v202693 [Trichoderma gamsii]